MSAKLSRKSCDKKCHQTNNRLERLPTWRQGQNHLVFNLYRFLMPLLVLKLLIVRELLLKLIFVLPSLPKPLNSGTWPDYAEDLSFDIGKAILAKVYRSF